MSDNLIRHLIALLATVICALAYYSGWISHQYGLKWTIFGVLIIYGGVLSIVKK
ncbi:MAG TPA: hypothetical protein VLK22_01445 [Candidatus Udaeobacter sp.]|nr:hypothetical protein [Candidatus Udaeobacter sp.]